MLDPSKFSFTRPLEECYETFCRELAGLSKADFQPWPLTGAYSGQWLVYPLFLFDMPPGMVVDFAGNQRRCPESMQKLEQIPRVRTACFSWLDPGSHIQPHTDAYYDHQIRAHLGVLVSPRALIRVDGCVREFNRAEVLVIDGQVTHEVANLSSDPRVTMLVDFEMTPEEEAYVNAASRARGGATQ